MSTQGITAEDAELRAWLLDQAEEHGHAVVQVAGDDQGAPYAFSVGAWRRFGVAEAVVVGLPPVMAEVLLKAYVTRAREGRRFVPGELHHDFFEGIPITVEKVARGYYPEFFGSAFLLYRKGDFPAVQILVPTAQGVWPWQDEAPEGFWEWQPVLTESGMPESWTPGVTGP
ncbi:DUF4262 domain-containing protein [Goodfellowiella coeruleoviolacea]|uniref:DUF4262 domain-containing protein n=1 Tax=Goodfellowiella coeruleoviolacea TaxID=334858 RepID=A0AAE3GE95_9PSEU|nr:DUF4262 domain-containing protein [Goodfellowiella coeruleoviolacea]MCP2166621.1 protein of unknown function (DUF4262) [Goodfellowiella coeruleoviolacea]